MNIKDIDWKNLVILEALLTDGNVSRVAQKLNLSQPAVSNSLAKLREELKDPLFIRTGKGMLPTQRAMSLRDPIRKAMEALGDITKPVTPFSPATSDRLFTLAMTDYAELVVVPKLTAALSQEAPGVRFEIHPLRERIPHHELEEGRIDMAVGYFPDAPGSLYQHNLFTEDFVCIGRSEAIKKKKSLTMKEFASLKHVLVAPWGGMTGLVDSLLSQHGLSRPICVSTPHFLSAPFIAAETGYVVTIPRRMANYLSTFLDLKVLEIPVELPAMPFKLIWHIRTHQEPAHKWLRNRLVELLQK